ncbi:hypothetical protein [Paraburkholderia hospita]|uniref:hypothetical protein n=1 Tax=Paraburkholderia hospita TaxID=169430 RepID=UPI0014053477|nr:hypothetical protein [Paraburkholderia hospita]
MELMVAGIAYHKGCIDNLVFSTRELMGVLTTVLTPVLFKAVAGRDGLSSYCTGGQM